LIAIIKKSDGLQVDPTPVAWFIMEPFALVPNQIKLERDYLGNPMDPS
jgi:hypothetical protein